MTAKAGSAAGLVAGVVTGIAGKLGLLGPAWPFLSGNIGAIFGVVAVVSGTLAGRFEFIPAGVVDGLLVATATLFVVVSAAKIAQRAWRRFG